MTSTAQTDLQPTAEAADMSAAYRLANLRRIGVGLTRALETPALTIALRCTAKALQAKRKETTA